MCDPKDTGCYVSRTHARTQTHAHTHARTHAHTHTHIKLGSNLEECLMVILIPAALATSCLLYEPLYAHSCKKPNYVEQFTIQLSK